ncbi:MAG: DUF2460 domain-containing protein [Pseudomonadota bacterium]
MSFHEVRFPTAISRGAQGGPERRTDVVVLGSGYEERNSRWADSRRSYNAGYGVKSLDDLHAVIAFFEERRGRLYGFRWRDHADWKSCAPEGVPAAGDQVIGTGDGNQATFTLTKVYGGTFAPWTREVRKPVEGSVLVAVDAVLKTAGTDYVVDHASGTVAFQPGAVPGAGAVVTAGFEFDVPVRFDTDKLEISLQGFRHGAIPNIPIVEIRL